MRMNLKNLLAIAVSVTIVVIAAEVCVIILLIYLTLFCVSIFVLGHFEYLPTYVCDYLLYCIRDE